MPKTLLAAPVERLTVLYDDDCGFCRWSVEQLRSLDRHGRFEFVPLQHAADHPERRELATLAATRDLVGQIHVVRPDGSVRAGGGAMLEMLDALPGGWLLRPWALLPGVEAVIDLGYRWVAGNRAQISGWLAQRGHAGPACDLHASEPRAAA